MAAAGAVLTAPEAAHARLPEEGCHVPTLQQPAWEKALALLL